MEDVELGMRLSQFRNLLHHHVHHRAAGEATTFWSGLGAIRREAFEASGGFDAELHPHVGGHRALAGRRARAGARPLRPRRGPRRPAVTSVSVVIATANRPGPLARCLATIAALDHPRDEFEVLVVDDAGSAQPEPVDGLQVRLLRGDRGGPGSARNLGAATAEGDLLAFTDDDCLPDPGWLRALCAAARPGTMIGGRTVNALAGNRFAEASQHIQDLVYAHYNPDPEHARFFATNNLAVPRDAFLALGGFDVASFPFASEDRDLCDRWRASGRGLRSAPDAVVRHAHDLDLRGFVRQHVAYGRGAARYHRARTRRGTGRLRDETAFHLDASLWLRTARLRPAGRAAGMVPLLALWQAANAAGYLLERRAGWVLRPAATK